MDDEEFTLAAVTSRLDGFSIPASADAVEFRMDQANDPLAQLSEYDGTHPVIATNRATWEGGDAAGPGRLATLADAATMDVVVAVDIELASVREGEAETVIETARGNATDLIVSWHDFDETPPRGELRDRLREAARVGDIGKAAVTATNVGDVLDLLAVTYELSEAGLRVATMSMGDVGRHSRVVAPIYGSRIGYAPVRPEDATAPGQFDLETFSSLLASLR